MMITLRYENVSHLYFSCGRIGHVAVNCDDTVEVQEVAYGEELRASPPRRTKEIMVKPSATRVARLLFQVVDMHKRANQQLIVAQVVAQPVRQDSNLKWLARMDKRTNRTGQRALCQHVKEMHDASNSAEASWAAQGFACKE
jgi:hypothetical protein